MKDPYVCTACGQRFSSIAGFDQHRVGTFIDEHPHYGRSCLSPDDIRAAGYEARDGVWHRVRTEAEVARLSAVRASAVSTTPSQGSTQGGSPC